MSMQALYLGAGVVAGSLAAYLVSRQGMKIAASKPEMVERPLGLSQVAKFPWGAQPLMMELLPPYILFGGATVAASIAISTPSGPLNSLELARGPVLATLLWIWGYYNHIGSQIKVMVGGGNQQASKVSERVLYNTIEQGIPFLALMWMTAACVDASIATSCGLMYGGVRMCYGLAYSYYGGFSMACELVTMPNYTAIHTLAAALVFFGLTGKSVFEQLGTSFLVWLPLALVANAIGIMVMWEYPTGKAAGELNMAYNSQPKK